MSNETFLRFSPVARTKYPTSAIKRRRGLSWLLIYTGFRPGSSKARRARGKNLPTLRQKGGAGDRNTLSHTQVSPSSGSSAANNRSAINSGTSYPCPETFSHFTGTFLIHTLVTFIMWNLYLHLIHPALFPFPYSPFNSLPSFTKALLPFLSLLVFFLVFSFPLLPSSLIPLLI